MEQATLQAPDISCDHCIQSIKKAVEKLPGVTFISGDPETKKVTVEFNPEETSIGDVEAAMEEEGYPIAQ